MSLAKDMKVAFTAMENQKIPSVSAHSQEKAPAPRRSRTQFSDTSDSGSSDSDGGGVLLADHPCPSADEDKVDENIANWLSSTSCIRQKAAQPATPSKLNPIRPIQPLRAKPRAELKKRVSFTPDTATEKETEVKQTPPHLPKSINHPLNPTYLFSSTLSTRSSPYAMTFQDTSQPTTTTTIRADVESLPTYHLTIIKNLLGTPFESTCPFFTAAACPQGPKCILKVLKPSTTTICPHYLKMGMQADKKDCVKKNAEHKEEFLHRGDEGFGTQYAMKHLRGVHTSGAWGAVDSVFSLDGRAKGV